MNLRIAGWLVALVVSALGLAQLLLRPDSEDRLQLVVVFGTPAAIAVVLTPLFKRWVTTRASVAGAGLFVAFSSLALGAVTTSAASNAMFLSSHDFRLFLVVLTLSCGISMVVGAQLSRPLARDIAQLGRVAERVSGGDLAVRTEIIRRDEVGRAATAMDMMIDSLASAQLQRERDATARLNLFSSIGHDLRTPLSAMRAAVESLQDGVAPDPDRYYEILGAQVNGIEALLDQLVEFARIESGHVPADRVRVSLAELADEAADALSPLAHRFGATIELEAVASADVLASPVEMSRVIRNLLENAVRHSPPAGVVRISVCENPDSLGVVAAVTDDGEGFPADFREHAFEPFTRADPARTNRTGHSGLGLAITRGLVESHGGQIWLGDGPGGDVRIWLPAFQAAKEGQ
jgi:two-component system sensor histidine kinase BaeS